LTIPVLGNVKHTEIFSFIYRGEAYHDVDEIVEGVVKRWTKFCKAYY
jgi:hypothetical protein